MIAHIPYAIYFSLSTDLTKFISEILNIILKCLIYDKSPYYEFSFGIIMSMEILFTDNIKVKRSVLHDFSWELHLLSSAFLYYSYIQISIFFSMS